MSDQDLLKSFKLYVRMFNQFNGTTLTEKEASASITFMDSFVEQLKTSKEVRTQLQRDGLNVTDKKKSTKRQSYDLMNLPEVDNLVYEVIKEIPNCSREQIAKLIGKKTSTICGAVNRLMKANVIMVKGTKIDSETNRKVEALCIVKGVFGNDSL